jgi:hypothetical protein
MSAVNNGGSAPDQTSRAEAAALFLLALVGPTYTTYGSQFAIKRQRNANIMLPTLLLALGARRSTLHALRWSYNQREQSPMQSFFSK